MFIVKVDDGIFSISLAGSRQSPVDILTSQVQVISTHFTTLSRNINKKDKWQTSRGLNVSHWSNGLLMSLSNLSILTADLFYLVFYFMSR